MHDNKDKIARKLEGVEKLPILFFHKRYELFQLPYHNSEKREKEISANRNGVAREERSYQT